MSELSIYEVFRALWAWQTSFLAETHKKVFFKALSNYLLHHFTENRELKGATAAGGGAKGTKEQQPPKAASKEQPPAEGGAKGANI